MSTALEEKLSFTGNECYYYSELQQLYFTFSAHEQFLLKGQYAPWCFLQFSDVQVRNKGILY